MSWINGQQLTDEFLREHVKDLENKKTMLLEEKRRNNEDLALLESEAINVETEKNDLAKTLGCLQYASFMREMSNQDLSSFYLGQKEDILSEQNQIFNFNMIWQDSHTEKMQRRTGKYGMALLESRCVEMETRNDDTMTQLAHNQSQLAKLMEENKDLRSELEKVMPNSLNSLSIQEWALGSQKGNLFPNKPVIVPHCNNNLDEQYKVLKDQIADLKIQLKNHKESEDVLIRQNDSLTNEVAKLKAQSLKPDTLLEKQNGDLRAQLLFHQEKAKTQLTVLQPQSVHMEKQNCDLREKVKRLQENKSCLDDDIRSLNDALARAQSQSAKMETQNFEVKGQVKALQENKNQLQDEVKSLNDQVALLQSQRTKMEIQNNELRAQIKALQENEDILIKQNETLNDEVTRLERSNVRMDKKNDNLRTRLKALKENENILNEKTESLMADLSHFEVQRENDQTKIYSLRTELQTLRCQLQDQDELLRRINHAESLMEKAWEEKERLSNKLIELEEDGNFVKKQNDDARVELEKNKSLQEQQSEQIAQLKEALKEHKLQLEDCHFLIYSKDDELEKQNKKIVYQNENTEELECLVNSFKQKIHELQCQLELKQMDEILTANKICRSLEETAPARDPFRENQVGLRKEMKDVNMQVSDLHQNDRFMESNSLMKHNLTLCESPSLKMETENDELRTKVKDLQENEARLIELNRCLSEKVAHLESWKTRNRDLGVTAEDLREHEDLMPGQSHLHDDTLSLKLKTENGDLRVQVQDLKDNEKLIKQRTETLKDERDKYKTENNHLKTYTETLESQLCDQTEFRRRADLAESQTKKYVAENDKLRNKLLELEEKDNSYKKQHGAVQEEMEAHKSVREQQSQQIAKLNAALKYNEHQIKEARGLLSSKEVELEKLNVVTEDMKTLITNLKQRNGHLQGLLDHSQSAIKDTCLLDTSDEVEPLEEHLSSASSRHDRLYNQWSFKALIRNPNLCFIAGLLVGLLLLGPLLFFPDDFADFVDLYIRRGC
ncbi:putative leucine-rich repeat-containing protein DDB_G0290503 [Corythoichthys intestinalis]|uniref:putative leucine-rich repeat-containing protein DDB_G0290503 n=1 Tax=Corythoichthys intestinalis TaxID=161448 RepID=UPI0025A54009|nr:putative leucine-rich repeat-containing protein DDB_G0290503 [Corythoichthys intestinalis]